MSMSLLRLLCLSLVFTRSDRDVDTNIQHISCVRIHSSGLETFFRGYESHKIHS